MTKTISNSDDVIDSRDLIDRMKDLEDERDTFASDYQGEGDGEGVWADENPDDAAELAILQAVYEQGEGSPDWVHGETMIRETYFKTYAEETANDCGMIPDDLKWPLTCIDWDRAAEELRFDYFEIDFDGVAYLIRA